MGLYGDATHPTMAKISLAKHTTRYAITKGNAISQLSVISTTTIDRCCKGQTLLSQHYLKRYNRQRKVGYPTPLWKRIDRISTIQQTPNPFAQNLDTKCIGYTNMQPIYWILSLVRWSQRVPQNRPALLTTPSHHWGYTTGWNQRWNISNYPLHCPTRCLITWMLSHSQQDSAADGVNPTPQYSFSIPPSVLSQTVQWLGDLLFKRQWAQGNNNYGVENWFE